AGARTTLFCYGRGAGPSPAGIECVRVARALSPRRTRAGPSAAKPCADVALAALVARAGRRRHFDALLAHNAEGALAALAARRAARAPVVYVAPTLWEEELGSWARPARASSARPALTRAAAALGARLDRWLAARADAVLVLCEAAARRLAPVARGPLRVIPPRPDPPPAPARGAPARARPRAARLPGGLAPRPAPREPARAPAPP